MICDICGERIYGSYYEMPDGMTVCAGDTDCLADWAQHYARKSVVDDGE